MDSTVSTPEKSQRELFLIGLEQCGNVSASAAAAGIHRTTAYHWRETDGAFRMAWDAALDVATDSLEEEARRRAVSGSDVLLIFLLKAHRPQKFRDNVSHEHSGGIVFRLEYADDFTPPAAPEPAADPPADPPV
jgi:hypothetical protein